MCNPQSIKAEDVRNGKDFIFAHPAICEQVIAHNSRADEIVALKKAFQKYDTAKNGVLSFDEFKAALHEANFSDEMLQEVFESIVSHGFCCLFEDFLLNDA